MRAVIQRVDYAKVSINNKTYSKIDKGILVFVCICNDDTEKDLEYIARKIINMRIFSDKDGKFSLSLKDIKGECLIVSQFTLAADTKKGNRPSYFYAMEPKKAEPMVEEFINIIKNEKINTKSGLFGADMKIELTNSGPVTINIDSKTK